MSHADYLEEPYLTTDYIASLGERFFGVQFEGLITKDKTIGSQFEGLITTQDNLGSQFLGFITQNKNLSSQFEGFIVDVDNILGSQFEGFITTQDNLGSQFLGFITQNKNLGSQFEGFIVDVDNILGSQFLGYITTQDNLGSQFLGFITRNKELNSEFQSVRDRNLSAEFKSVLYNTKQFRFMYSFPSRGFNGQSWTAQQTAFSSSNAFDVNNLNSDINEKAWRSVDLAVQNLTCDTAFSGGVFVDTLAILDHNMTLGAVVILQASDDNFVNVRFQSVLNAETKNMFYIADELPKIPYRYWRLILNDPTNPDGYLQIGTIVFGSSFCFNLEENITSEIDFKTTQFADTVFTEGFTNISNDRGQKNTVSFSFENLNSEGRNFLELRELFKTVGNIQKVLWIPYPPQASEFAVFAKMKDVPNERHKQMGKRYVSLKIDTDESL